MATTAGSFASTLRFLADLRAQNDREWFAANRDRYQADYVTPAREFVAAAAPILAELAPGICAEPRIDGSILRITRDMRFVRGGPPYKTHLDIWFWHGERATAVSGLYLRLTPEALALGAGTRPLAGPGLARFRDALTDPDRAAELITAIDPLLAAGWELNPERYRRTPGGVSAEPVAGLLRRDGLRVTETRPHPPELASGELLGVCVAAWSRALAVHRWLVDALTPPRDARCESPLISAIR